MNKFCQAILCENITFKSDKYCRKHRARMSRNGCLELKTVRERLEENYLVNEKNGCWEWMGMINKAGYGRITIKQKKYLVHRAAYQEFIGLTPNNLLVCHKCDNPKCINPDHLFLGTHKDNGEDKTKKGRAPSFKGSKNPSAKLKEKDVKNIRKMHSKGIPSKILAIKFNINVVQINNIIRYASWKDI